MASYNSQSQWSKWALFALTGGAGLLAINCGFSDVPSPSGSGGSGAGLAPGVAGASNPSAGNGQTAGGMTGTAGSNVMPTAGSGPGAAGANTVGGDTGTGGQAPQGTFKNYSLTGTWPNQPVAVQKQNGTLTYKKISLHDRFLAESCSIADYNNDGIVDVSAGRRWYEGPFGEGIALKEHIFRGGHDDLPRNGDMPELVTGVSDDWACYPFDMDGDGNTDIINIASCDVDENQTPNKQPQPQPHATAKWYKNPGGAAAGTAMWQSYDIHGDVRLEQHGLVDVDGDGKPEIYGACKGCNPAQTKGYYYADWTNPTKAWSFRGVTKLYEFPFSGTGWLHGLGFGDVNKDGKPDLLERGGVWTNAAAAAPDMAAHYPVFLYGKGDGSETGGELGGSHMFAADVDGDDDNDIISADFAHNYGISWYEQTEPGKFTKHRFVGSPAEAAMYNNIQFSQPHAMQVVDMDNDGVVDVVVGKMRFAHPNGYGDPDLTGPAVSYVFKIKRGTPSAAGSVTFEPHAIDTSNNLIGVGRQLSVGYISSAANPMMNDGIVDICTANKLGLYLFIGQ